MTTNGRRTAARKTWRLCRLITVTVLSFGAAASCPASRPASAASNGVWSVFPTTLPGQAPREFFHPVLQPGKTYRDAVTVANYTAAPLTFNLYASDAFNTSSGGLSLRRRTDVQIDIGKWISLPYHELIVPARSATSVPFTIVPPLQASPGDHVGGIVAEQTQGTTSHSGSVPITVVQAVGVRVYGKVEGPLHPRLVISRLSMTVHGSVASLFGGSVDARVRFSLHNAGNTVLSPHTSVVLTTPFGSAGQRTSTVNQLLPGSSLSCSMIFRGVNTFGHLRAEVTAAGVRAKASTATTAWSVPWALLTLVVLVLGAFFVVLTRRRRHGRTPD